jgi:hypothetical protein
MGVCPRFAVLWYHVQVHTHLAMGRSPVQGDLPKCMKRFVASGVNSESEEARGHKP